MIPAKIIIIWEVEREGIIYQNYWEFSVFFIISYVSLTRSKYNEGQVKFY